MKTRCLAKEVPFWSEMAKSIGKPDVEKLWKEHGSIAEYLNKQIKMLITDISAGNVSLDMFTVKNAKMLRILLDHPEINPQLVEQLEKILYGGDERKRFFNESRS